VRRRRRQLAEEYGPVRLVRREAADPAWLERFFRLEAAGWKGRAGSAIACVPRQRAHYEAVAAAGAEHGWLALYELECAGEPVAMHFGLEAGGRYQVLKLAYDEAAGRRSPGQVLVAEILQDCVARGLTEFDCLGKEDDWKGRWASGVRPYYRVVVYDDGIAARAAYGSRHLRYRVLPVGVRVARRLAGRVRAPQRNGREA
jgi:CelD/BcsL family acetyltransferase involved in cellulose biosynthesis